MVAPRESCLFLYNDTIFLPNALLGWDAFPNSHKKVPDSPVSTLGHLTESEVEKSDFYIVEQCFSNMSCMYRSHGDLVIRCTLCLSGSWVDPRLGFPNKFPGDVEVA